MLRRLAVIGIANTHDIDERVLPRIASRLGSSKLAFVPYKAEQIITIAKDRLQAAGHQALVDPTAVDFAARKVRLLGRSWAWLGDCACRACCAATLTLSRAQHGCALQLVLQHLMMSYITWGGGGGAGCDPDVSC
jgi:hypothetical protein